MLFKLSCVVIFLTIFHEIRNEKSFDTIVEKFYQCSCVTESDCNPSHQLKVLTRQSSNATSRLLRCSDADSVCCTAPSTIQKNIDDKILEVFENCECVPYYQWDAINIFAFNKSAEIKTCSKKTHVCCPKQTVQTTPKSTENDDCSCVMYYLCDNDNLSVKSSKTGNIKNCEENHVCCPNKQTRVEGNIKNINDTILEFFNNCTCIPYYLCSSANHYIVSNGSSDVLKDESGSCSDPNSVCCSEVIDSSAEETTTVTNTENEETTKTVTNYKFVWRISLDPPEMVFENTVL